MAEATSGNPATARHQSPGCPIARRFAALALRQPQAAALLGPDGQVATTRGEVQARAAELAARLGPRPGETGLLSLPNSAGLVAWFLALRRAGLRVALVDASAPAEELARAAEVVDASVVVAPEERLPAGLQPLGAGLAIRPAGAARPFPGAAVFKLTSGSTGLPTAVAVSARALVADVVQILGSMDVRPTDITLAAIPMTHSFGLGSCLLPLLVAGTPLVLPTSTLPAALLAALAGARVAHFPAVPAMVRALAGLAPSVRLPHLRVCLAAGAPLAPADAAAFHACFGVKVHVFYGASECGGIAYDRSEPPVHDRGVVGTAMDRVVLDVLDQELRPVPAGSEGRVRVRSLAAALGTVPTDPGGSLGAGAFLTSDLGVIDEAGRLTLTGRVSDLLNVAGKKVHPEEIRRVIEALPGVRQAVVVGLPDRHRGELVAAVVAIEPGANVTAKAVLAACRQRLAPHKMPRRLALVDELPTSDRGKVRRDAVLALLARHRRAS